MNFVSTAVDRADKKLMEFAKKYDGAEGSKVSMAERFYGDLDLDFEEINANINNCIRLRRIFDEELEKAEAMGNSKKISAIKKALTNNRLNYSYFVMLRNTRKSEMCEDFYQIRR